MIESYVHEIVSEKQKHLNSINPNRSILYVHWFDCYAYAQNISQNFTRFLDYKNNLLLSNKMVALYVRVFSCQVHLMIILLLLLLLWHLRSFIVLYNSGPTVQNIFLRHLSLRNFDPKSSFLYGVKPVKRLVLILHVKLSKSSFEIIILSVFGSVFDE